MIAWPLIKALVGSSIVRRGRREERGCRRERGPGANREVVQRMVILLARHLHRDRERRLDYFRHNKMKYYRLTNIAFGRDQHESGDNVQLDGIPGEKSSRRRER